MKILGRRPFPLFVILVLTSAALSFSTRSVMPQTGGSGVPPSPDAALLHTSDFRHLHQFARQLARHSDPMSAFVWHKLSPATVKALTVYLGQNEVADLEVRRGLAADLNLVLTDKRFYDPELFSKVRLRGTTRRLIAQRSDPAVLIPLNRALLENAYPGKIAISIVGKVLEAEADNAQGQADQAQEEANQAQQDADQQQQQANQEEAQAQQQEQQQQADQAQQQADNAQAQAIEAQGNADEALATTAQGGGKGGWTWGEFAGWAAGGAVGGAAGGAVAGGLAGAAAGALGGTVGGALGYAFAYWWGSMIDVLGPARFPRTALDGQRTRF